MSLPFTVQREAIVTREEARQEIRRHCDGLSWSDAEETWHNFLAEAGDRETYKGSDVLDFLGY